ncbi:MAG TPA: hypothetical protein VFY45_01270 [Baekduia sp.]|nr:hypothetical protein [Baekduia sp.]
MFDLVGPVAAIFDVDPFGDRLHPGSGAGFVVLVAFILSFLAIRTSARLTRSVSWWPGGVETDDGLHLHHLVWGICLVLICGFLAFAVPATAPWWHMIAIGFGIGAGFTLDEFALWVRLKDVYWTDEGRASFDAVVIAVAFAALVVEGTTPFGLDDPTSIGGTVAVVGIVLTLSIVSFLKERLLLGVLGLFIPVFGAIGALRLGKPTSIWARRRYSPERMAQAQARFAPDRRGAQWGRRLSDLIAGAPSRDDR